MHILLPKTKKSVKRAKKETIIKLLTVYLMKVDYSWSALLTVVKVTSKISFIQKLKS